MALIICPECGREISDYAVACPHCGKPLQEDYAEEPSHYGVSHGWLFAGIVLALMLIMLFITCPGKEKHRERISSEVSSVVMTEVKDMDNGFAQFLTAAFVGPLVNHLLDEMLVVDSYGIVSVGRFVNIDDGKDRIVSIGIANYVYTRIDDEAIKDAMKDSESSGGLKH